MGGSEPGRSTVEWLPGRASCWPSRKVSLLIDIPNVGTKNCCRHSKRNCEDGRTGRAQVRRVNPGEPQGGDTRGPERLSLKPAARGTASLDMPAMTQQRMCRIHLQPVKARLASMLNGLGPPGLYDERRSDRQRVDDLDTARPLTGSRPDSDSRRPPQLRRKRAHNGHCVTLELRPGYNMSHRMGRRGLWHGHCKYNWQRGPKPVPKVK
jgi:hypothetical protein